MENLLLYILIGLVLLIKIIDWHLNRVIKRDNERDYVLTRVQKLVDEQYRVDHTSLYNQFAKVLTNLIETSEHDGWSKEDLTDQLKEYVDILKSKAAVHEANSIIENVKP